MKLQNHKNSLRFLVGLSVIGLALGTSAFTTAKMAEQVTFTKVSGPDNSTNPADYEYQPNDSCEPTNPDRNCSADWIEDSAPALGDNPTGTFVPSSLTKGSRVQN